jgi:hypothetical protein
MTSRDLAVIAMGADSVLAYERVKAFYTRLGVALERSYAERVGGRLGRRGEADVITRLGEWEFCAAANTKNAAGEAAQRAKVGPQRIVQVTGTPTRGRITGVEFLRQHGVPRPDRAAGECEALALERAREHADQQLVLIHA